MSKAADILAALGDDSIPSIYRRIRAQRTRAYKLDLPPRASHAEIQFTLLGIELKVGRRRFACPDLSTARYLQVFTRLGCGEFAIPYDISQVSAVADELETSWRRTLLMLARGKATERQPRQISAVIKLIREEITAIGAGDSMPVFDRKTRNRQS
ncbi:MAG: hypothetical protein WKF34_05130 [Pyrinomonadaceae bacterium]